MHHLTLVKRSTLAQFPDWHIFLRNVSCFKMTFCLDIQFWFGFGEIKLRNVKNCKEPLRRVKTILLQIKKGLNTVTSQQCKHYILEHYLFSRGGSPVWRRRGGLKVSLSSINYWSKCSENDGPDYKFSKEDARQCLFTISGTLILKVFQP